MSDSHDKIKRGIRSFVVRSSRMTTGQQKGWDDYWHLWGLDPKKGRVDFVTEFGNANPVVLEIGFGMGQSLIAMAEAAPEKNFIGIEVHRPGVGALLAAAGQSELKNLRVFCCDANEVIDHCIPASSLERVQLFFPDPWHKKRHHKRRLVQDAFVQRIRGILSLNGVFHMATDWEPYAEHMLHVMQAAEGFENLSPEGTYSAKPDYRPTTKFESRGERLGHGVWDLLFQKTS